MSSRKPGYPECPAVPRGVIGVTSAVLHPRPPPPIKKPTPKLEDKKRVVPAIRNVPRKCKPLKTKSEQPSLRSKPVKNSRSLSRLDRGPIQGLELAEYKDDNLKDIGYLKIRPSEDLSDVKREKKTILEMVGGVGVHRMPVEDNMWKTDWKEEEPKKMKKVTKPQALQAAQLGARYKLLQTQKPLSKLPLTLARRPLGVPKRDCTHAVGDRPSETLRMVPQKLQTLKKPAPRQIADPKVLLKTTNTAVLRDTTESVVGIDILEYAVNNSVHAAPDIRSYIDTAIHIDVLKWDRLLKVVHIGSTAGSEKTISIAPRRKTR
ncbi:hypothetical protein AAG570_007264 [Ranatra chinensis]|uniref:Uncharacterized protein n=1 Tax=Ranatra chinensis TaxID=642074 RepID=A0ABD0Y8F4_9HEMI